MKVLFWNTHKNEYINTVIKEIVLEHNISLIVLAEYKAPPDELINLLLENGVIMGKVDTLCERITMFSSIKRIDPVADETHWTIQIIDDNYILGCVHLNSQIYNGNKEQREIDIGVFIENIQRIEEIRCTENTVIVGDFNINPFDKSCIDARYFSGLPVYEDAKRKSRTISGKEFKLFYNPMWNFLGDFKEPYGTYYYSGSEAVNTFWNIFDQVIIRPAIREKFIDKSLKILTQTNERFLLDNKGHPDMKISDHLPIIFEIREG